MGAFTLVNVIYRPLKDFILSNPQFDYYATDMEGHNIFKQDTLKNNKFGIIFGNEGSGISSDLLSLVTATLSIPPKTEIHPESLNLSISVGIVLSQLLHV
jgi:tRNA G18 (ribose-2'-O)-methylase SpoU